MAKSPLDQFKIEPIIPLELGGVDLSFTNSSLWMGASVASAAGLLWLGTRRARLVPGYAQMIVETLYGIVSSMVHNNIGKAGLRFFPAIFALFLMIMFGNLLGLVPGAFTFTSHIIVNFFIALVIFFSATLIAIARHKGKFFAHFLPKGTPLVIAPLMIPVEILSYLSRPISLSVRLFANMVVGHILLKVVAGFVVALGVFGIVPWMGLIAIYALELLVAMIQAYVFTILSCVYLNEALNLH